MLEAAALGATRIGHGIHIATDAVLMRQARERGLHFEVCPSSNVHTGAAASLAAHPIREMLAAGLSLSVSTDNRLMSGVSLSGELQALHQVFGLGLAQIRQMQRAAAAASFMPWRHAPRRCWRWGRIEAGPAPRARRRRYLYSSSGSHSPMPGNWYSSTMAMTWMPMKGSMPAKIWFSVTCGGLTPFR